MAGQPTKYKEEYNETVFNLCSILGADDKGLSEYFKVTEKTLNNWKTKYPEFFQSLKKGKDEFDTREVETALRDRATGYSHPDTHISNFKGKITTTNITKHYPPDTTACIFWLCNRNRLRWKSVNKTETEISDDVKNELIAYADALNKSDSDSD